MYTCIPLYISLLRYTCIPPPLPALRNRPAVHTCTGCYILLNTFVCTLYTCIHLYIIDRQCTLAHRWPHCCARREPATPTFLGQITSREAGFSQLTDPNLWSIPGQEAHFTNWAKQILWGVLNRAPQGFWSIIFFIEARLGAVKRLSSWKREKGGTAHWGQISSQNLGLSDFDQRLVLPWTWNTCEEDKWKLLSSLSINSRKGRTV